MNTKQYFIVTGIFVALIIGILVNKSGVLLTDTQKQDRLKAEQTTIIKNKEFIKLPHLTFPQLDKKIKSKDPVIVYFGWLENCGDSRLFEMNSFDTYLRADIIKKNMVYVNLDQEAPKALLDKNLREPIAHRFLIDTWTKDETQSPMKLQAPQIAYYRDGKLVNLLSWTPLNADYNYGIKPDISNKFFTDVRQDLEKLAKNK